MGPRRAHVQARRADRGDDRGEYRLSVAPGRHLLRADAAQHTPGIVFTFAANPGERTQRFAGVYYSNARDARSASPVEARPGQQIDGIDFSVPLVNTYSVRGTLIPPVEAVAGVLVTRRRDGDETGVNVGGRVEKGGAFEFGGLEPGGYWLVVFPRGLGMSGMGPVDVGDRDVDDVVVRWMKPFALKGRVLFDPPQAGGTAVRVRAQLLDTDEWDVHRVAPVDEGGAFTIESMTAGEYALALIGAGTAIKSVRYGGQEVGTLDLSAGPAGEVEIVLGSGAGEVAGSVDGELPEDAVAVLVSARGVTGNTGARFAEAGGGRFAFRNVAPGRYFVFAGPAMDDGLWQNMPLARELSPRAAEVEVTASGSVNAEVRPYAREDIRAAIARLGL